MIARAWMGAAAGALLLAGSLAAAPAAAPVSFAREIAPVLLKRCTGCHGERAGQGGYRAHTLHSLMRPGKSGARPVVPGKPEASRLFRLLTAKGAARMPKGGEPLTAAQVELFRRWIAAGAPGGGADPAAPLQSLLGPRMHPEAPAVYRAPVPVLALAFAPGGAELAVGGYHEVVVREARGGAVRRRLQRLPQRIQALVYARDGKALLVGGGSPGEYGEAALVDPAGARPPRVLDTFPDIVLAAAFSRDGALAAAAGADASVRVYEVATGRRLWTSRVHSDWVTGLSFSPDGRFLASSGRDMAVKVHEAATGTLYTTYTGHNRNYGKYRGQYPVYAVRFASDAPAAFSAGGGKVIQLWEPEKARLENGTAADMEERFAKESHARYLEHGFEGDVHALALAGGQLFAGAADGVLRQFDAAALREVRSYRGHADWIYAVDFEPAARRAASGDYRGEVRVWDTETGECLLSFPAGPGAPRAASSR